MTAVLDSWTLNRTPAHLVLPAFGALLMLSACDDGAPGEAAEQSIGQTIEGARQAVSTDLPEEPIAGPKTQGDPGEPYWRMESDGKIYEGRISLFFLLEGDPMIQFVNQDAINLVLVIDGEMTGEQAVRTAIFVDARKPPCRRVGEVDSFRISFDPSESNWLTGSFQGMLGCPDYSLMPVDGSFHIRAPGEPR